MTLIRRFFPPFLSVYALIICSIIRLDCLRCATSVWYSLKCFLLLWFGMENLIETISLPLFFLSTVHDYSFYSFFQLNILQDRIQLWPNSTKDPKFALKMQHIIVKQLTPFDVLEHHRVYFSSYMFNSKVGNYCQCPDSFDLNPFIASVFSFPFSQAFNILEQIWTHLKWLRFICNTL